MGATLRAAVVMASEFRERRRQCEGVPCTGSFSFEIASPTDLALQTCDGGGSPIIPELPWGHFSIVFKAGLGSCLDADLHPRWNTSQLLLR